MKKFLLLFLILLFCALASLFLGNRYLLHWANSKNAILSPVEITLEKGMPLDTLAVQLKNRGVVSNVLFFRLWVRFYSDYSRFQAGPYRFEGSLSPEDLANAFIKGDIYLPVVYTYTIPEGHTAKQVISILTSGGITSADEAEKLLTDAALVEKIDANHIEGYLYPATYPFIERPTAVEALSIAIETFFDKLPDNYREAVDEKGLTLHEAVIFASLIELETARDDERNKVSEVIWNRLNKGIPLGIDASIIYGIKDYAGNLTRAHLKDVTNPYNTRIHGGLPPGPIGSPSRASLEAVLTPTNFGYYYYVVDAEDSTVHHFSKTLREHNQKVRALVKALRKDRHKK